MREIDKNLPRQLCSKANIECPKTSLSQLQAGENCQLCPDEVLYQLEEKNDELRYLTEISDRYIDLYEYAPVTYCSLNVEGIITKINLTGAKQFGLTQENIINQYFSNFIALESKERWNYHFLRLTKQVRNEGFE